MLYTLHKFKVKIIKREISATLKLMKLFRKIK